MGCRPVSEPNVHQAFSARDTQGQVEPGTRRQTSA